jgi:hypothetical protein
MVWLEGNERSDMSQVDSNREEVLEDSSLPQAVLEQLSQDETTQTDDEGNIVYWSQHIGEHPRDRHIKDLTQEEFYRKKQGEKMTATAHAHEHQSLTREEQLEKRDVINATWTKVEQDPDAYIDSENYKETIFAAGGGLVRHFGMESDELWTAMLEKINENQGKLNIAGIDFSEQEFRLMGGFYNWLNKEGLSLAEVCIDERVDLSPYEDQKDIPHTHKLCGAGAGLADAIGWEYDKVMGHVKEVNGESSDQEVGLQEGMEEAHTSLRIYANLADSGRAISKEKRGELQEADALPFEASLPLGLMKKFAQEEGESAPELFKALIKWNINIAKNIIAGAHSTFPDIAEETVVVFDTRDAQVEGFEDTLEEVSQAGKVAYLAA